jgi:hypothetical protein
MGAAGDNDDSRSADAERIVRVVERVRQEGAIEPRVLAAWRSWLSALASDAEAAIAAALAYSSLGDDARRAWLDALDADASAVDVPRIALYAPLLAVEADAGLRARISDAIGAPEGPSRATEALRGETAGGDCICVILSPVYLDFVEMLVCRYRPEEGIVSAHHDPLRHVTDAPRASEREIEAGVELSPVELRLVVEELAHAVVADRREGRDAPEALAHFSHLFVPDLGPETSA